MDQSAFILARDHKLPVHVFDAAGRDVMRRLCEGDEIGTFIGPDVVTVLDEPDLIGAPGESR
jgi:uridylate kinase